MASFEQYSVDAVLNFTVQDIRDLRSPFLDIEGWSDLPPEKRTECLTKLRDLMNREAQTADSIVLDAKRLAAKLRQIPSDPSHRHSSPQSPLSSSEISTPPPLDPQEQEKERLRQENEAYEALIQDGCHPSHPVHRRFDVLDDPGDHKAIVSYWESPPGIGDYLFTTQLNAWRRFRHYQQNIRRHYLQRDQFPHYQEKVRERRRRHGYGGLIQLHPDRQQQSRLDDWMEFQDAQLRCLETLEDDVEQAHMQFESRHRPLEVAAATESEPADKAGDGPFAMAEALALAQNEMAPAQPGKAAPASERYKHYTHTSREGKYPPDRRNANRLKSGCKYQGKA
ncbi:MAG: hypothetical protein M1817_004366 [Caeruleum heppii]|nr:MAG: hypothetical protein M1817_004366 [Caeruleum heppii]